VNNGSRGGGGGGAAKKDGFLKLTMKVPDLANCSSAREEKCRNQCSENCSCVAYASSCGVAPHPRISQMGVARLPMAKKGGQSPQMAS
jgi:hypothetical protein